MKITKFIVSYFFLFSSLLLHAQIPNGGLASPGDCNSGSSASPSWHSGNQKLTSSCSDVNVGIGTNYPSYPLQVVGQANIDLLTTSGISIGTTIPSNACLEIQSSISSQVALTHFKQIGNSQYKKMIFMEIEDPTAEIINVQNTSSGFSPFLLTASGGLTIQNSTGKTLQLEASGLLHSRRIKIDTDIWPDYVFDSNYDLMPLNEVEKYIKDNNHLPKIPSSKDMISNGIDLQEMNVLLLEKIEELTLHLINQQKEIEQLKLTNKTSN